jgi:hypothetical protein
MGSRQPPIKKGPDGLPRVSGQQLRDPPMGGGELPSFDGPAKAMMEEQIKEKNEVTYVDREAEAKTLSRLGDKPK